MLALNPAPGPDPTEPPAAAQLMSRARASAWLALLAEGHPGAAMIGPTARERAKLARRRRAAARREGPAA